MDQFEAAKLKHAKNLERRQRTQVPVETKPAEVVELPKEEKASKPSPDAIFEVVVKLPDRVISFSLKKRNVLSNVNPRLLNKDEIAKAVRRGLEPLMGGVE